MKYTGLLLRGPLIQVTLDGRKTKTRRIVKPQPDYENKLGIPFYPNRNGPVDYRLCPYGGPGDRIYFRETWRTLESLDHVKPSNLTPGAPVEYAAGGSNVFGRENERLTGMGKWRPSIFMPRWASRITLEITGIRVERLQDITEAGAIAEGCSPDERAEGTLYRGPTHPVKGTPKVYPCARAAYRALWESINGPGSWELNPYVWVIEFKDVKP